MTEAVIELCSGRVMHARLQPFVHRFVYRVFCIRVRIDCMSELLRHTSWLFGVDRSRPVSFKSKDHGARDGSDLQAWMAGILNQSGIHLQTGAIWLQCFPRVFGYVFNPVSFWFVHDQAGVLRVLVAEVNNTFGQRHQYVLAAAELTEITASSELSCLKVFHVSPFCEVRGAYRFRVDGTSALYRIAIDYHDPAEQQEALLRTAIVTKQHTFTVRRLLGYLASMPMMTFGVMLRIHLQAFKLWRKGATYHTVPSLPDREVTGSGVGKQK